MKKSINHCLRSGVILAGLSTIVQTSLAGSQETGLKITLRIHNYAPVESEVLIQAEQEVTRIYRKIGVETAWLDQQLPTETKQENSPRQPSPDIVLTILAHAMAEAAGDRSSLGISPGAGRNRRLSYVFQDRVEDLSRNQIAAAARDRMSRWATRTQILGCAMAHEIGHLLGLSHSRVGIMRSGWRWNDLLEAAYGNLTFTPEQALVIRMEVGIREH